MPETSEFYYIIKYITRCVKTKRDALTKEILSRPQEEPNPYLEGYFEGMRHAYCAVLGLLMAEYPKDFKV